MTTVSENLGLLASCAETHSINVKTKTTKKMTRAFALIEMILGEFWTADLFSAVLMRDATT
jgi:hypothetical protein